MKSAARTSHLHLTGRKLTESIFQIIAGIGIVALTPEHALSVRHKELQRLPMQAANPLVQDGEKLIPTVTRAFISTSVKPGEYDCQVTVLDSTGAKAAFWQAPIMLIP